MSFSTASIRKHEDLTSNDCYLNEVITYDDIIVAIRCDGPNDSAAVQLIVTEANRESAKEVLENIEEFRRYLDDEYDLVLADVPKHIEVNVVEVEEKDDDDEVSIPVDGKNAYDALAQKQHSPRSSEWYCEMIKRIKANEQPELTVLLECATLLDMENRWDEILAPVELHAAALILSDIFEIVSQWDNTMPLKTSLIYTYLRQPSLTLRGGGLDSLYAIFTKVAVDP